MDLDEQTGVEPLFRTWDGEGDPTWFVNSMNLHRRHLKEGQRHMIAARWADAEVGRPGLIPVEDVNTAQMQDNEKTTVTVASKVLKVGERGIYHAKVVLSQGTPEEISDCDSGKAPVSTTAKKIRAHKTGQHRPHGRRASRAGCVGHPWGFERGRGDVGCEESETNCLAGMVLVAVKTITPWNFSKVSEMR